MKEPNTTNNTVPSVRKIRHRMEVPMLIVSALLTALAVYISLKIKTENTKQISDIVSLALLAPVFAAIFIRFSYWQVISNAVEINSEQMPDLYKHYLDVAEKIGMKQIPRLYLANGNGLMNAFASKCTLRKKYVVIYSDIVDVAYEMGDMNMVRFVLSHELGHIYCGHVNLWRMLITTIPNYLMIGSAVSRAQEYSADRCGAYFAPEGADSMLALFAGKRAYKHLNMDAYLASVNNHKKGFWMFMANFVSSHPVGFRRVVALSKIKS